MTAVEVKEFNDVEKGGNGRQTVGGRYVFHHLIYSTRMSPDRTERGSEGDVIVDPTATGWPVHEVGRNADVFGPEAARLLRAHSYIVSDSAHLHSNGRDTTSHLEIGFKFAPKGFQPKYKQAGLGLGRGQDIDIDAMEPNGQLHSYAVLKQNTKDPLVRAAPPRARHADVPRGDLGQQHRDAELHRIRPQLGAWLYLYG